ncbi:hypothetical protein FNV43_RR00152 [Rhamnella rubrinervis]|uniref:Uncharacterized protein n=1 Tax=Rhamnella rubrinervis TaxID=2594499 RepID=A0A8K0HMB1_9ROSA|nr:hypothetical protein FNV43_RR00152 [Rhamnella rubrinervis]
MEMRQILRPHGSTFMRDYVDIIVKVEDITNKIRWNAKIFHSEKGPSHPEKILLVDYSDELTTVISTIKYSICQIVLMLWSA